MKNQGRVGNFSQALESLIIDGFAHGTQRVAQANQSGDVEFVGHYCSNASTHGFAPDNNGGMGCLRMDDFSPAIEQNGKGVGRRTQPFLSSSGHIGELEPNDLNVFLNQQAGQFVHPVTVHGCTSTMGQDESGCCGEVMVGAICEDIDHGAGRLYVKCSPLDKCRKSNILIDSSFPRNYIKSPLLPLWQGLPPVPFGR